jgi:serine protease AprX
MEAKRIIAHFMHEHEREAARPLMQDIQVTEGYLLGSADDAAIEEIKARGLVVQVLPPIAGAAKTDAEAKPHPDLRHRIRRLAPRAAPEEALSHPGGPQYYLVRLQGPLLEPWRKRLDQIGVRLLEHIPPDRYTARLQPAQLQLVREAPFVLDMHLYSPGDTGPVTSKAAAARPPGSGREMQVFDLRLHRDEDLPAMQAWLEAEGVSIAGSANRKIRIYLLADSAAADRIAARPEIAVMEEYVPPRLHNNIVRILLGIERQGSNPGVNISLEGNDQIVGVADTGLDERHPDFQGRISGVIARGRPADADDPHGHGTHVAGSVLGDGAASHGKLRGIAPKARLFMQSLLDADGNLGGLPLNLADLFEEAYQAGVRIHNNSWGSATGSMYTLNSSEVDEFVGQRRDMLIVLSAGNEGQAADRLQSRPGFVDWLSIGSPASSKNALTVGASRSQRLDGAYNNLTYGAAWPAQFPDPPIAGERVSGDPEAMAGFSSRGPCEDRRIKPDVVAPGTDIASARSGRAPLRNFWGAYPGNPAYAFMGGTSMAAPLVSGCAALVREYYTAVRGHTPSAALLKATLINGTRWLTGPDALADHVQTPNFHQGFGCVHLPWTIPNVAEPQLALSFVDSWKDPAQQFVRSGQRFRYQFGITGGSRLRICLAWTDLPARGLQNNLNLFLQHTGSAQKWIGNEHLPLSLGIPDPDNNVEVVRLESPLPGDYLIQITATNLLRGPQDFALVVVGESVSDLLPV